MKKRLFLLLAALFLLFAHPAQAATDLDYKAFDSKITVNKNLSITVTERVVVDYLTLKHGIFRDIPEKSLTVMSVTDEKGNSYNFEVSGGNSKRIKIGDADIEITGEHVYLITYEVKNAIKKFDDHYELYWNVTGDKWDDILPNPSAIVESFATITKVKCFTGIVGGTASDCRASFTASEAKFASLVPTGVGSDFTIVVGFDKNAAFVPPTTLERILDFLRNYWFYFLTIIPFAVPLYHWLKKGRDERYIGENIYYEPSNKSTRTVGLFERRYLPLVYSPIRGLTPAQVGTILDEKVDMADVVAEIMELGRLGFLTVKKTKDKSLFRNAEYQFKKLEKDTSSLNDYQQTLLDGLFQEGDVVTLADLKNKFYLKLSTLKKELYQNMEDNKFFDGNPESIRNNWLGVIIVMDIVLYFVLTFVGDIESNIYPYILLAFFSVLGFVITRAMPRRTAKGYSLFRQIEGLKWYVGKGRWKHEIAEKKLFVEEMLPLAISLGVVSQLTSDMQVLGLKPPSYVSGVRTSSFTSDLSSFQSTAGSALASSPGGKGGSSGFSGGGSSGGGGGGGGGGGW